MVNRPNFLFFAVVLIAVLPACTPISPGKSLFLQNCAARHATTGNSVIVGPSLAGVATRAETRVAGLDARAYILQSITDPSAGACPEPNLAEQGKAWGSTLASAM